MSGRSAAPAPARLRGRLPFRSCVANCIHRCCRLFNVRIRQPGCGHEGRCMKDLEIERVSIHVVGPETERHAWASDMHTQYMTNNIVRLTTRGGLEGIAGVSSFTEFGFDRAVAE